MSNSVTCPSLRAPWSNDGHTHNGTQSPCAHILHLDLNLYDSIVNVDDMLTMWEQVRM